jgi:hypothetical protein
MMVNAKEEFAMICRNDGLVCLDYGELIDTVHANYGSRATATQVLATFNEIMSIQLADARHEIQNNMDEILKQVKE